MKCRTKTKTSRFKCLLDDYFFNHKTFLIILCGAFIVGIAIGIFSYIKFNNKFSLSIVNENFVKKVFSNTSTGFSFFANQFFGIVFNMLIIFLLALTPFLIPFSVLYIGYLGYVLGANAVTLVLFYGAGSIFGLILFFIPIKIVTYFLIINYSVICNQHSFSSFKYGKYCKNKNILSYGIKTFLIFIGLIAIICLLEVVLVPASIKGLIISI